jgi:hypothetical protein
MDDYSDLPDPSLPPLSKVMRDPYTYCFNLTGLHERGWNRRQVARLLVECWSRPTRYPDRRPRLKDALNPTLERFYLKEMVLAMELLHPEFRLPPKPYRTPHTLAERMEPVIQYLLDEEAVARIRRRPKPRQRRPKELYLR